MTTGRLTIGSAIDRALLSVGDPPLGRGGQGTVYPTSVQAAGRAVAYKEYSAKVRPTVDPSVLDQLIGVLATATAEEQTTLVQRFAWPLAIVSSADQITGFAMPRVPAHFHVALRAGQRTREPVLAQFQHLLNAPKFLESKGIRITHRQQFHLLAAVADAIDTLHRRGIAVGDLSPMNLLYSVTSQTPAIYFIDCDAMIVHGRTVSPQAETPSWETPPGEAVGTAESDAYKFGLLVLRLLAGHQDTRDPGRLPAFADSVRPLLERALTAPAALRPRPADWIPSLTVAARKASDAAVGAATDLTDVATVGAVPVPDVVSSASTPHQTASPTSTYLSPTEPRTEPAHSASAVGADATSSPWLLRTALVVGAVAIVAGIGYAVSSNKSDYQAVVAPVSSSTPVVRNPGVTTPPSTTPDDISSSPAVQAPYTPEHTPPTYTPPTTTEMPGPPDISPGASMQWSLMGPYSSEWTCDQTRSNWPVTTSVCFTHDGSAYFWGMSQK